MTKIKLPTLPASIVCHDMDDVAKMLEIMTNLKAAKTEAESLLKLGKKAIKAFMEEHDTRAISQGGFYAKLTEYRQDVFDQSAFKAANVKLAKRFTVTQTLERFSFGRENE
ncbi:MAG: hypothetical protein IJQ81_18160 [Oscillibacter sp.]|nr:hypothetical protein [Paludibacteraceae bacterium]MBR0283488.1 hypothetical protein [Oscillibacter sp.]